MALSTEQKQKLEKLSIKNEGLAFVKRGVKPTPTATVIISLGGLGGDTLNQLKKKMLKNLGEVEHIYCLAVDTADDDLKAITRSKSETGYLNDDEVFGLYEPTIAHVLLQGGIARPSYTYDWMRDPFPQRTLDETGAQGVRQIGRLMLTCGSAYKKLEEKINSIITAAAKYNKEQGFEKPVIEIMLLAGVSGGTGSGTIIDVSYLVHRVMATKNIAGYRLSAYVYTPDVQFNVVGIAGQDAIISNLSRNGYAAIKEIDYFMNLSNHNGVYELNMGGNEPYTCDKNIYDSCTIITGTAESGGMTDKAEVINNLTENLVDLLTDISYEESGSNVQMAKAFSSNKVENLAAWYSKTASDRKDYPKAANYCYQVLGYSSVSIPKDEILAYCVNKMFQSVHKEFNRLDEADETAVATILAAGNVTDADTLTDFALGFDTTNPINTKISLPHNMWPKRRDVKEGTDTTLEDAMEFAKEEADKVDDKIFRTQLKTQILNEMNKKIDEYFDDKGPYFAVEVLTHKVDKTMAEKDPRKPFAGVLEKLDDLYNELLKREQDCYGARNKPFIRNEMERLAEGASKVASKVAGEVLGIPTMAEYVDYVCCVAKKEVLTMTFNRVLKEIINEIRNELIDVNNKIFDVYTEVLDAISAILQKDAEYVTSSERHGHTYTYSVINLYEGDEKTARLKAFLDDFVSPTSIADLCDEFIKSMRNNRKKWIEAEDAEKFDVVSEVRTIFDNSLEKTLKTNIIEKFVVAAYSPKELSVAEIDRIWEQDPIAKDAALQSAAEEIVRILNSQGSLMASTSNGVNVTKFLNKSLIAVLDDTPNLSKKIHALYGASSITKANSKGLTKYISSRIVYNVPLYLLKGFDEWDLEYRNSVANIGIHMDEVKQDWRRFPQPFIIDIAAKNKLDYESFADYQILLKVKENVDKAIETYKFVVRGADSYILHKVVKQPQDMDAFRKFVVETLTDNPETELLEIMANPESGYKIETEPLVRSNSALDPLDITGEGRYVEIGDLYKLVRMSVRFMDLIEDNLKMMEKAKEVYDSVMSEIEKAAKYASTMLTFANALKAGIIKDEGKCLMSYMVRENKEILVDLRAGDYFDKQFVLYHAFVNFFNLSPVVISEIKKVSKRMIEEDGIVDTIEIVQENVDEILGEDVLGSLFAKKEINEEAKESEMTYTFVDTDVKDPHSVLLRFYTSLKKRLR